MLKPIIVCISCLGILFSAPSIAGAQTTRQTTLNEVTLRGTVQAVDHTARTVTVQGEDGRVVTLDVPTTATRFDQVKVGDIVTMTYYDRVSVRAKPAGEAAVNQVIEPTTTATPGALPGATRARQRVATMTLTALDPATRSVTFSGPTGSSLYPFPDRHGRSRCLRGSQGGRSRGCDVDGGALTAGNRAAPAPTPAAAPPRGQFPPSDHDLRAIRHRQSVQRQA